MKLIYTMNSRVYICYKLWTIILVLLSTSCKIGSMNISDESKEVLLTTTIASDSPNVATTKDITTIVINISTTTTSPKATTVEESTAAVIKISTTPTSKKTTVEESISAVINNSTSTASPVTTTVKESTSKVIDNYTTSTSIKTTTVTIRGPPKPSQERLVLCQCGSGEVINHTGQCQPLEGGTSVLVEPSFRSKHKGPHFKSTTKYNVKIYNPKCQYQQIDLHEGEFMLRDRGDLLVFKGHHRGFRVAQYCIQHKLIKGRVDSVDVTARGCVPQPVIPRCCSQGKHINNGECVTNPNIAKPFSPYLGTAPADGTGPAGVPFPWNDRQEHIEKPTCAPGMVIKKFELDGQNAYLAASPKNVLFTFLSNNGQRDYRFPHQYCVDVQENNEKYHAYSCEWNPDSYCKEKICTVACCPDGQAFSFATRRCVPNNKTLNPPFTSSPSSLETLYNWPKCNPITNIKNFSLDHNGTLIHRDNRYPLSKFCIGNFIIGDSVETGGMACIKDIQETTWHMARKMLFPVCIVLSCVALVLLILLHIWIPKLREKEGKYQLFHAASLFLAYSVILTVQILVPDGYIMGNTCVVLAFVMQFAFLSAFFWLNTMCFDVWRLFRNLVRSMYSAHTIVSIWKYVLYALGGPLIITVITIIIQYVAPKDGSVPGLVHPHIGEGRCWFRSGKELLTYFYGPIAVLFLLNFIFIATTYYYLKIIRGDYKSKNDPSQYTITSRETTRKYDFFSAFWQRFYLLVLVATCWLTEILSWLIPPEEMWAATDILNNLQGVFVFFIFLSHHNKRALLKEKLPKLFKCSEICIKHAITAQTSLNTSTKKLSRKISSSTIISNMSSFSSFSRRSISTSSFSLSKNEPSISSTSTSIRSLSLTRSPGTPLPEIPQKHCLYRIKH